MQLGSLRTFRHRESQSESLKPPEQPLSPDGVAQRPRGLTRTLLSRDWAGGAEAGGPSATFIPEPLGAIARVRHRLWRRYACRGLPDPVGWVDPCDASPQNLGARCTALRRPARPYYVVPASWGPPGAPGMVGG
eukprot:6189935-Pleurochrysis_carterae.AAC.1